MKALMSLLLVASLFSLSCSTNHQSSTTERSIANEVVAPLSADELLTFKSSTHIMKGVDLIKKIKENLDAEGVDFEFIKDEKMSTESAYRIVPSVEAQSYKFKIYYSAVGANDLNASAELIHFFNQMFTIKMVSPYAAFELLYNVRAGDFISLQVLAKLRAAAFETIPYDTIGGPDYEAAKPEKLKYWNTINEKFETVERVYNKKIKILENERKEVMDALDKAADDQQFRNLVAKNDRKGAAALLRKYLPWEHMPPFEKLFWENHLAVIADPLPFEDRVFIYRGIDDDIIQVAQEGGKELSREEAIKEQKMFLMSTMMTKNQGTWNRRLRSLTAMYEKFMGTDNAGSSDYTKAVRITNMFTKHSREPKGSPFLSYTPNFSIANSFGSKRNTAYFIDPRIMYFNYASRYAGEIEFLLPIMSFPDDLAAVYDSQIHQGVGAEAFMKKLAIEKLDRELGSGKGATAFARIELNSKKFFKPVMGGKVGAVVAAKPDGKIMAFFKNLFGMPTKKAAEVIDEKSDMACLDLIQTFWK